MGHRNIVGTLKNGVLHGSYAQWGGYPTGTPREFQTKLREFLNEKDYTLSEVWELLRTKVDEMTYVDEGESPTPDQAEKYAHLTDGRVSTGGDWYATLRNLQGNIVGMLMEGIATDQPNFLKDSLFCEYGMILDFDSDKVVLLRGFNKDRDQQWHHCRSATPQDHDYVGCALDWEGPVHEFLDLDLQALEDRAA